MIDNSTYRREVKVATYNQRLFKLERGDIFYLNDIGVEKQFSMPIKKLPLDQTFEPGIICLEKIKRKHWWQFWKKKYTGARFMYVGKDGNK